ncbi:MAG: hypothetical protein RLP44_09560 [Aggregatilineales bacterium]
MSEVYLTPREEARIREQTINSVRSTLELKKPKREHYIFSQNKSSQLITNVLAWSKISVPIIAVLAAMASSVRTLQTASEIYSASGSHSIGVAIAAITFTLSTEGAIFVLALAQEGEKLKQRREKQPRHVMSLLSLWRGVKVRIGLEEPLRHDELTESSSLSFVMFIALFFAMSANAYIGLRPLLSEVGAVSIQDFLSGLWSAPAELQITFVVDFAAVLFPPLMALTAGHLTARFAVEIASESQREITEYESALQQWREWYTAPLETEEGQMLFEQYREYKLDGKRERIQSKSQGEDIPLSQAD